MASAPEYRGFAWLYSFQIGTYQSVTADSKSEYAGSQMTCIARLPASSFSARAIASRERGEGSAGNVVIGANSRASKRSGNNFGRSAHMQVLDVTYLATAAFCLVQMRAQFAPVTKCHRNPLESLKTRLRMGLASAACPHVTTVGALRPVRASIPAISCESAIRRASAACVSWFRLPDGGS